MEIKKQISEASAGPDLQLPMGQLFYLLYHNGFSVKPDDYIEMLKITERFGTEDIDATARWICPIIATSEAEQEKFYNVIEQYKKRVAAEQEAATRQVRHFSPVLKWVAGILLFCGLLLAGFLLFSGKGYLPNELNKERTVEKGEPLAMNVNSLLNDRLEDTGRIQFSWQFGDGTDASGNAVSHVFRLPGDYHVRRKFSSSSLHLLKKEDTLLVHVCNDLPKISIIVPDKPVPANEPCTLTARVDAEPNTVSYYQWNIGDSVFTTTVPEARDIHFPKEADYSISCSAVVGNINSPCTATDNRVIKVLDKGMHYNAGFTSLKPGTYTAKSAVQWWVSLVLLVPAIACFLYALFRRKIKKPATVSPGPDPVNIGKGPFEIPFEQNDVRLVQQERELQRTFIQMRYKAEEETLVLNIPATINSIIRSGGSPQLVFAPMTQQQQYLVLIDRANPKSMQTRFFTYLVKSIAADGIPIALFYYDKNFTCYNDHFPGGIPLQRLAETSNSSTLIILGKAHELVYNVYPLIEERTLRIINQWQSKAVITPVPLKDWGAKDKLLQEYFVLLPADIHMLQKLMPALREKYKPRYGQLAATDTEGYSLAGIDFRDTTELKAYLGNDETIFQWLCATCIYPRLRWEVLVETGKTILDNYHEPEKLNYTNLLRICRIPWMQQGVFPQATRLELLKLLTVENELLAREKLLQMLNYSTSMYGEKGYFFEEEKKRQQLTNRFILHASDQVKYGNYAESREAFRKLWTKDGILDVPLKKYLDKSEGDTWQTPVSDGRQSVGLRRYFNLQDVSINKKLQLRRIVAVLVGAVLMLCWIAIQFGNGAAQLAPYIKLTKDVGPQLTQVNIRVIRNFKSCGDSLNNGFARLSGYLDINNEKLPLSYDSSSMTASFNVPIKSLATGKASIMFEWDNSKSLITPISFLNQQLPDSVTIGCTSIIASTRPRLNIRFNDAAGYKLIEAELASALYQYNISAVQADFSDSSRIVYYEPNQLARADSIAQAVGQQLGIAVREEFISETRTPAAVPILFINTATPADSSYKVPDNAYNDAANKAEADDYHRMADQYFQDKQYLQAIQEYARALNMNPKDELAYYQRGISYEMLGAAYADKAIAEYSNALSLNPKDAQAVYRRGSVRYELKRYADAITDFSRVIALNDPRYRKQTGYSVYYRGKSYYALKNSSAACDDFKRAAALGITAARQDYASYCNQPVGNVAVKPDCSRTFYSMSEASGVDALLICKLDFSREKLSAIPRQVYGFKNLAQLNLGSNTLPQQEIDQLQKALPSCKIIYGKTSAQPAEEIDLGNISLDQGGYTDQAGQQVMQRVSRLLKAQPAGKIRLTANYSSSTERKTASDYMSTIVNMFAKIGVNTGSQVEQKLISTEGQQQQQQQQQQAPSKNIIIHVTGINLSTVEASKK